MKKGDPVLIGGAILAAAVIYVLTRYCYGEGAFVTIAVDGVTQYRLPLSEDRVLNLRGIGGSNTVVIEGGCCRVSEADCPDRLCVDQGGIHRQGEMIVCLPHRVVISVAGGGGSEVDAVSE